MATMDAVGAAGPGRIPVEVARQAAVLARQKQVMEQEGEQAQRLIESAAIRPSQPPGVGQLLDLRA